MARTIRNRKLDTRNARLSLVQQKEPYWEIIGQGLHIGYYKGRKSSSWHGRYRNDAKTYISEVLALTDDVMDADGIKVLNFYQAQDRAREWFREQVQIDTGNRTSARKYTVATAMEDYLKWFKAEGKKTYPFTLSTYKAHIESSLGKIELQKLSARQIHDWRNEIASKPPRIRSKSSEATAYKAASVSDDNVRKRRATTNRILTVLKAGLNHAYREGYVSSDEAWRRVKPFHHVDVPSRIFLSVEECRRLMNACDADFRKIVQAAIFTGCRYSELANLLCSDFEPEDGLCLIRTSKSGKSRRVTLSEEGRVFFEDLTVGKDSSNFIFTKSTGDRWSKSHQSRPFREALKAARIDKNISFHGLRDTHASHLLGNGVPMAVIAAQLGNSVAICEKHYAHLTRTYIQATVRNNIPEFYKVKRSNVTRLAHLKAKNKRLR